MANQENGNVKDVEKKKISPFKILKITWRVIEKIIMILILFISLIIVTQRVSNNENAFLGYRIFRVQTGSMIPKYQIGDVILVKEAKIDDIVIGDDVTYWGTSGTMAGRIVTHQVIDIEMIEGQKAFHTKGIANNLEDPIVYGGQINGIVQGKLHILTSICTLLTNQYAFYFLAIVPLTFLVFFMFLKRNARYEE